MRLALTIAAALFTTTAYAQSAAQIGADSLAKSADHFAALPDKTPSDNFALGALHFLRGVEKTLQTRWEYNATLDDLDIPVMRLPVPANPEAKPFEAGMITGIFTDLLSDMDASRAALAAIPDNTDVALEINLADLWFDINMNGTRDTGEGVIEVGAFTIMAAPDLGDAEGLPPMNVRFDTADVAWLTAYTHMLSAAGELVVAFDPTEAITNVMNAADKMDALRGMPYTRSGFIGVTETRWIDQFAMVYGALNQQPDATRTRAAHAHLLNMIAENKTFWAGIDAETDNANEWIPNANQTSALGIEQPPEAGMAWQVILDDVEAMLNGDLLIPYWRLGAVGGVNVQKLFLDPPTFDIVTWVQGHGLLPYLERGPLITPDSFEQFEALTGGNLLPLSFLFN
ncbi:hypothetical protein [Profundibacter sp.]